MAHFQNIKAIVTDIEGTTSSISFVKDVLFPYASEHLESFVLKNLDKPEVKTQLIATAQDAQIDETDIQGIIQQLQQWIEQDVKATPLKTLQGMIWKNGYEQKDFKAHMYPDATQLLKAWHQAGIPLYVYSSGSVQAQKLFFGYSEDGDLLNLFSGHFDTQIGHKQETASYRHIIQELKQPASQILFLSDIAQELDAAKQAGMQTCHVIRASEKIDSSDHPSVGDFKQIHLG